MDCCSKCPPADYRLQTSQSPMLPSGRLPLTMGPGNNGVPIPGAFYNQLQHHHLHATPMRYPHSMYRLSGPGVSVGSGAGYNVIGPPPPAPLSLSSASSVSSNSSVSPPSQSPASPSLYPTYERYGNYGNIPPYVYRGRDAETNGSGFNYANLNHRLDINCYYGRPNDSYNRYAANFAYRHVPSDCEMLPSRRSSMGYGSAPYGHPAPTELQAVSTPVSGLARYHNYNHGRHTAYDPHPFNYFHMPAYLNRGVLHREPIHPHMNGVPYRSPAASDFSPRIPNETSTHASQHIEKAAFNASETVSDASPSANSGGVDCSVNSHMRGLASSNAFQYHQMRPETPLAASRQQHSTDIPSAYDVDEEITKKVKERDKFLRRTAHMPSMPLESPAPTPDRVETPFPNGYNGTAHNQNSYSHGNHVHQNIYNRMSPYSAGSPYSWTDQYSPKSVRRRPSEASASPTNFVAKNRVLEYDVIPSKKSRKNIKIEDVEYTADMREETKDITPLPGFQQAFGSTEIGRFSENFLNTPERLDYFYESEPDTYSPQPWETGDSLEGPHYNLHIGATVVQPEEAYSENQSSTDSPIENNYFSEIQCSDY